MAETGPEDADGAPGPVEALSSGDEGSGGSERDRWLKIQLVLAGAGAVLWYVGAALDHDFVTGAGVGVLLAALALRFPRRGARRSRPDAEAE